MGVDRTDYIIYGFMFHPKVLKENRVEIFDNKYLPYIEGHPGIKDVIVYDGMSGNYIVFGKLINRAEEHRGTDFTTISFQDFFDDGEKDRISAKFIELFGELIFNSLDSNEPEIFVFSHYS